MNSDAINPNVIPVNGKPYTVLCLLGKGKSGYSHLVLDEQKKLFVLKSIHHEPCDYYTFGDKLQAELDAYARLSAIGITMPKLIDVDYKSERILKEYIDGDTIACRICSDEMRDDYLSQIKQMCRLLYAAHLNIDYYPTNFIVNDGKLYYIDYECNDYSEEWNFENWGVKYWSKTPEFCKDFGL